MSAIRNSSGRAEARKKRSAPYARGVFGTVARWIGYLTGHQYENTESEGEGMNNSWAAVSQSNGRQNVVQGPRLHFISGNRAPLTPNNAFNGSRSALPEPSTLPIPSAQQVATYFSQRMGTNVTTNEVESMITNLQTTPEHSESFRFTFTTPGRELSPSFPSFNVDAARSPSATPSKKLARNPNGVYRWEGAGSAKAARHRNRFASPAFGASPVKPSRPVATEERSELPGQDNKRRKVSDGQPSELTQSTMSGIPFPNTSPSTTRTNGTSPVPSRLRTPAKPTAPINPSPLRQAWSDASSTSSHEDNRSTQNSKQTKAANFVAELIKETAPPKKPDISNPYQTASPVGKVGPPRRATKRPRVGGRPALPTREQRAEEQKKKEEEEKLKALSAQAIIEATLPKGSKRSRPPAHLEKKTAGDTSRSASPPQGGQTLSADTVTYIVEEVEDSEMATKRPKSSEETPSQSRTPVADVTVEELEDVDMDKEKGKESAKPTIPTVSSSSSRTTPFTGFKPSTVPREPSKLRFSFQAESSRPGTPAPTEVPTSVPTSTSPTPTPAPIPASVTVPTPLPPSIQAVANGFDFSFKTPPPATSAAKDSEEKRPALEGKALSVDAIKTQVRAMDSKSLPAFVLTSTGTTVLPSTPEHVRAREAAKATSVSSLPTFDFASVKSFGFGPANPKPTSSVTFTASSPPLHPFAKPSSAPTSNVFGGLPSVAPTISNLAPIKSFKDATSTGYDEPSDPGVSASTPPAAQPVKAFDWGAAGFKAPTLSDDTWRCAECGLSNPKSAAKCTICDAAPAGSSSISDLTKSSEPSFNMFAAAASKPIASSVKAFDFEAAGMKPPAVDKGTWVCSLCGLSNPQDASICKTCENPK